MSQQFGKEFEVCCGGVALFLLGEGRAGSFFSLTFCRFLSGIHGCQSCGKRNIGIPK